MSALTKVSGTWREMTVPYAKVAGSWAIPKSSWVKVGGQWRSWFLQGGLLDSANTGTAADSTVFGIATQPDAKIINVGFFAVWNGATVNYIVRLNPDGSTDTSFTTGTGTGANNGTFAVAVQSDGKLVVSGNFTTFNGATVNRVVRLNSDGTRDTAFTTNTGTGGNANIRSIAIQADGKIILVGEFTTFNGATANRVVRLNSDGTTDTAFTTNTGTGASASFLSRVAIQPDGKILLTGGLFNTFNGVSVGNIVRLNSDGTRDTTFATNIGTGAVGGNETTNFVGIQSDGKLVLVGGFATFNGVTVNGIVRLNSDGTRDTAFTNNTGTGVAVGSFQAINSTVIQADGKIILGGFFTAFNGATANRVVRLNSDGTTDTAFITNTGTGANNGIMFMWIQPDTKILLGGQFTTFNGTTANRFARTGGALAQ